MNGGYNYTSIKDCKIIKYDTKRETRNCYELYLKVITTIVKADIYDGNKLLYTIKY